VRHHRSGSSHFQQQQHHLVNARGRVVARATLDDPELAELVRQLIAQTPAPPASRPKLEAAIKAIDEANAGDPKTVPGDDGRPAPFRLAYSQWLTEWVKKLDPDACDELLILARGKSIESWKLSAIRRDDFAPNAGGQKMWEFERKRWVADRLLSVMEGAGYDKDGPEAKLVEDVMIGRNIPNPRDMRPHDLVGPFGLVNLKLLAASRTVQTLADAEALLFLDRSFSDLFDQLRGGSGREGGEGGRGFTLSMFLVAFLLLFQPHPQPTNTHHNHPHIYITKPKN
jgi:hypothetical protein